MYNKLDAKDYGICCSAPVTSLGLPFFGVGFGSGKSQPISTGDNSELQFDGTCLELESD